MTYYCLITTVQCAGASNCRGAGLDGVVVVTVAHANTDTMSPAAASTGTC